MAEFAVVEFEEYPDEWVRLRISGVSMRGYEAIVAAASELVERFMPEQLQALRAAILPVIDSWSFADQIDEDGLAERDPNWLLAVAREWLTGVRGVPLPLRVRSSDTEQSEDPSPDHSDAPSSSTES